MSSRPFRFLAGAACALVLGSAVLAEADIDWRSKAAVTSVKNQGTPGFDASWAFAVAGAVEGYRVAHDGLPLVSLSAQELIDCVPQTGDCADPLCGQAPCGLNFAVSNGLCTESDYPYTALQGTCRSCTPAETIPGWSRIVGEAMLSGFLNIGPVIARLSIGDHGVPLASYTSYTGGDFLKPAYSDDSVHQWVLVVGYTPSRWIVKNSLGTSWGVSGYIFLERGKNTLGIEDDAYAPSADTGHGACALPDGSCADMTAVDCTTANGTYGGDLSFCPAACPACAPLVTLSAKPRPTKKGSETLTVTVTGTATDGCAIDPSTAMYWVVDSYDPGAPIVPTPVVLNEDGSFSFPVSLAATRSGKRSHVYKIFVTVEDTFGITATGIVAVPIT
jgi:hypothetical protein